MVIQLVGRVRLRYLLATIQSNYRSRAFLPILKTFRQLGRFSCE